MDRSAVVTELTNCSVEPVRYLALRHLKGLTEDHPEAAAARQSLMEYEPTRRILSEGGKFWNDTDASYWKYTGRFWQMIYLGWFLADGQDSRIAPGVESILDSRGWILKAGGHCLTANILAAARRLGFADHEAVTAETETLAERVVRDRGLACEAVSYGLLPSCYMAIPKLLLSFAEVPVQERSAAVREAVEILVSALLERDIFVYVPGNRGAWMKVLEGQPRKADLPEGKTVKEWVAREKKEFLQEHGPGEGTPKKGWVKFGFPLSYNSDILEAMYSLSRLEIPLSPHMAAALGVIRDKMRPDGTWTMENSFNGKMRADVETKGEPSMWLTYFATRVLDRYGDAE